MIDGLSLSKFKAFNNKQNATLKPITLIYGPNSAGKSTLLQSLLLLKQSVNEYGTNDTSLITKGKLVDLGNYQEMVYGHNDLEEITISNNFKIRTGPKFLFKKWQHLIKTVTYESCFSCDESRCIKLNNIKLYYNNIPEPFIILKKSNNQKKYHKIIKGITRNIKSQNESTFIIDSINTQHPLFRNMCKKFINKDHVNSSEKDNIDNFHKNIENYLEIIGINVDGFLITGVSIGSNEHTLSIYKMLDKLDNFPIDDLIMLTAINYSSLLESIIYLGPLREYPERHYIFSGISPMNVGKSGKYTTDLLFLNPNLIKDVNNWLEMFNIDYEMVINKLNDTEISDVYSMRLIDKKNKVSVSPLDVGFGISQILPIIVQSLISTNSIICIEQPEIHIHPRLQTVFGSFIANCIKSQNQFIIETHSEHLMLRIQKLIREKKLKKEDVSVLYVDKAENGSVCIELRLDDEGDFLDEWPDGFFEEGYREVFF